MNSESATKETHLIYNIVKFGLAATCLLLIVLLRSQSAREFVWDMTTTDAQKASYYLFGHTGRADMFEGVTRQQVAEMKKRDDNPPTFGGGNFSNSILPGDDFSAGASFQQPLKRRAAEANSRSQAEADSARKKVDIQATKKSAPLIDRAAQPLPDTRPPFPQVEGGIFSGQGKPSSEAITAS